ncbi:MAG: extracellular solute-binding protein, partial [Chloroflexota bacterium]
LYRFLAEEGQDFSARNYFLPEGGPGSIIMVSGVGVLNTAGHPAAAQRFVDFLLSLPAQQYFASQTFEYPVVDGVALAAGLPPLSDLDAIAAQISLADLADLEGTARLLSEVGVLP